MQVLKVMRKGWESLHKVHRDAKETSGWCFSTQTPSAASPISLYRCCQKHHPQSRFLLLRSVVYRRGDLCFLLRSSFQKRQGKKERKKKRDMLFSSMRAAWCGQTEEGTVAGSGHTHSSSAHSGYRRLACHSFRGVFQRADAAYRCAPVTCFHLRISQYSLR